MSTTLSIPVVPISDKYNSSAAGMDLCSSTLQRDISHGAKKAREKTDVRSEGEPAHTPDAGSGRRRQERV